MENIDDLLAIDVRVLRLLSHVRVYPRGATLGSFVNSEYARDGDARKSSGLGHPLNSYLDHCLKKEIFSAIDWAYGHNYFKIKRMGSVSLWHLEHLDWYAGRRLQITRSGEVLADRFIWAEKNCEFRMDFIREKLFDWLTRNRHSNQGWRSSPDAFKFRTNFFGHPLDYEEINDAALYLVDRGLIAGYRLGKYSKFFFDELVLTTEGLDCVKWDLRITDYLKDRERRRNEQGGSVVTNYHISDSQQFVAGSQQEVIQHNRSGLELQQLIELAQLIRQVAPTLNLDAQIEAKLVQVAGILEEQATDRPQERGRLRRAGEIMMKILRQAAPTAARDLLVATAEKSLSTIIG